jgi:hypothetical protein
VIRSIAKQNQPVNAMNVNSILNNTLSFVTPNMHATRRKTIAACVTSMLAGATATVTSIGRGIQSDIADKHNIKRADRLLSNSYLLRELPNIYALSTRLFTAVTPHPVIHIDWSDLDEYKRHFLLRASMAFDGRSVTLYEEVHDIKTKEKPQTHKLFLNMLKVMLPDKSVPIIVTDAGFKGPWFSTVSALGWHYVGRARKPNFFHTGEQNWQCITSLYPNATNIPEAFTGQLCRYRPMDTLFVLYKEKPKGRHKINRYGTQSLFKPSRTAAKRSRDPWLLVTSLPSKHNIGKKVVSIYQTRMQIEEGFRDMKSHRYGLGFDINLSKQKNRISILILLTTLSALITTLIGWTVTQAKKHRRYQANSIKDRRVLSYHFIGLRAFVDRKLKLTSNDWKEAIMQLKVALQQANYDAI